MWSGPRNLSTAMMYAFAARGDADVVDEPFYAAYLAATGLEHPMREAVLAAQPQDPDEVVAKITRPLTRHLYLKLMTQHMIDGVSLDWIDSARHVFLIRHPARVVASYGAKREDVGAEDLGFRKQREIMERVQSAGLPFIVTDSTDIRRDPEAELRRICAALDIEWTAEMLRWPEGGHASDGIWAAHWYGAVHRSTGFAGVEGPLPDLSGQDAVLADALMEDYTAMKALVRA